MFVREMLKVWKLNLKYLKSFWNLIDIFLCFVVITSCILDMIQMNVHGLDMTVPNIIYSYAMFFLWIRIISFFRGFDKTSFLLRLIFRVIYDIRFFLLFILISILGFTYSAYLLQGDLMYNYDQFDFFILFYRLMLGDFNYFDNYTPAIQIYYFLWILLMFSTILLSIIMLNLLISIIQGTFDKVIDTEESMKTFEGLLLVNDFEVSTESKYFCNSEKNKKNDLVGKYLLYIYNETNEEKQKMEIEDVMKSVEGLKSSFDKNLARMFQMEERKNYSGYKKKVETESLGGILKEIEGVKELLKNKGIDENITHNKVN